jgi:hypothetical protein
MKGEIMERLRAVLPDTTLSDIRFRVGHVPNAPDPASDDPLPQLSTTEQQSISSQADCIQDEELRSALEAVMRAYARNKKSGT